MMSCQTLTRTPFLQLTLFFFFSFDSVICAVVGGFLLWVDLISSLLFDGRVMTSYYMKRKSFYLYVYTRECIIGSMGCMGGIAVMITILFWKVLGPIPSVDHFICHVHDTDIYQISSLVLWVELL